MKYTDRLAEAFDRTGSIVCVGLDPDLEKIPVQDQDSEERIVRFFASLIDGMSKQGIVNTVKPNYAFFAQYGFEGLRALKEVIEIARESGMLVILDAKRGDIGATAEAYAKEVFDFWEADAVTVNPYLGRDSIEPFLKHCERGKGVYVLAKTSNPGAGDFQDLQVDGMPAYERLMEKFLNPLVEGTGFVMGATYPEQLKNAQRIISGKNIPLLIPGVGSQGGSVKEVVNALNQSELYLSRINSAKGIIYAESKGDWLKASLDAIKKLDAEIK
ncbi:MAG: orotidine-5'-phosphate decarboxylase [Nanoarchaeota archaeon]